MKRDLLFAPPADDPRSASEVGRSWCRAFVSDDPLHPTDPAYKLMRDVRRRLIREKLRKAPGRNTTDPLGTAGWSLPGCRVLDLKVSAGKVRPADDVSSKAYFWLVVTLTITEDAEEA